MPPRRTDLESGAVVVSDYVPGSEAVSFGLYFPLGSRHETAATNGISHFIEHLVFKGTPTRTADEINREIDLLGGGSNAYTTKETICLHTRVLKENLSRAVELFVDLATHALPNGVEAEVERERDVILSEIKSVDDSPEDLVGDLSDAAFYGEHPLALPIMGSVEAVSGLQLDDLRRHYQKLTQSPLVVAAAGNVTHDEFVAVLGGALNGRACPPDKWRPSTPRVVPSVQALERDLEQVHVCLSAPGLAARDPRWAAAELLSTIAGDGYSSRLFREVRDRRGLAYSVYSSLVSYTDVGSFNIEFSVAPAKLDETLHVIGGVMGELRDGDVTEDELCAAKQHLRGSLLLGHESSGARMGYLAEQVLCGEDNLELARDLEAVQRVQRREVVELAGDILSGPLALAAVGPVSGDRLPRGGWELGR